MKIGIITLNSRANYGGILQAYAMTMVLSRLGHDAKVIYLPMRWSMFKLKFPLTLIKRLVKKALGKKNRIFSEYYNNKTFKIVSQHTQRFIDNHVPHVVVNHYEDLREPDWDAFVVGSDQVWRPEYMGYHNIEHAFLKFAEHWPIRRVAYAASFGRDQWAYTKEQDERCGRLVKLFDAVSVRETSAVDLCMEHWGINAEHVLDPTMLLRKEDYETLVVNSSIDESPENLLCYILDETEEKTKFINFASEKYNLVPFRVNSRYENTFAPVNERIQPPVEQWLRGFMDAKFVITDSFHATVFSILFKKDFIVIGNEKRGMSRFSSILSLLGLENRLIKDVSIMSNLHPIDWNEVDKKLDNMRKKSTDFLKSSLSKEESTAACRL